MRHPRRADSLAKLAIRATSIDLKRPKHASHKQVGTVPINVVQVREVDSPEGEKAVEWLLLTSEPIGTSEEVARIVDLYRPEIWIRSVLYQAKVPCESPGRSVKGSLSLGFLG